MKTRQHMVKLGHRDAHEPAIRAILNKHGVRSYRITGEDGVPDLLCRLGSVYFCIEIKADKAPLNKAQQAFRDDALYGNAPHYVVRNADEAAEAVRLELARRTRQRIITRQDMAESVKQTAEYCRQHQDEPDVDYE